MTDTKTCPYCAEQIKLEATKCKHCREFLEVGATANTRVTAPKVARLETTVGGRAEYRNANPWRRFWARMLDGNTAAMIGGIFLVLPTLIFLGVGQDFLETLGELPFSPRAMEHAPLYQVMYLVMFPVAASVIEAGVIAIFGTTPGKALLGLKLRGANGEKLSFGQAFQRTIKVWYLGLAAGFPLIALFTLSKGYNDTKAGAPAGWDKEEGRSVVQCPLDYAKVGVYVLLLFLVLGLSLG